MHTILKNMLAKNVINWLTNLKQGKYLCDKTEKFELSSKKNQPISVSGVSFES